MFSINQDKEFLPLKTVASEKNLAFLNFKKGSDGSQQ